MSATPPPPKIEMRRCPECGATSSPHDLFAAHARDCRYDFVEDFDGYETLTYVLKLKACETCNGRGYVAKSSFGTYGGGLGYGNVSMQDCPTCRGRKAAASC